MSIENWTLLGADDQEIYGTTHQPDQDAAVRGVAIICHGFKGYKDYGFFPQLADALCHNGLIAHRFNFSHSGVTEKYSSFDRPDLFECDTWGKQIHDLLTVARSSHEGRLPGDTTGLPVFWFGHSRGGVTVLLASCRAYGSLSGFQGSVPHGIISAAAPMYSLNLDPEQIHRLCHRGYIESPSSRTGQVLRIGKDWLDEIEKDPVGFDPMIAIGKIPCPILLLHGDGDTTVPVEQVYRLGKASGGQAKVEVIEGASHTFNAPNPLPLNRVPPLQTQRMIDLVGRFIEEHLELVD